MSRRDRTTGSIAVLLVVACCLAAVGFAAPAGAQSAAVPQTDDQPAPDNTITRIDLAANGSATWEITLRTRLENDSDVAEYERFQEEFRSNTSRYVDPFADRMSGVVAAANDSSDREMRAGGFDAETSIQEVPRRWGVVSFRFTWTGFAAVEGDAVVAGDVFAGGFFIDEDDALAIAAPDGYVVESAAPAPDETADGVVEWLGREDFDDGRPRVRAVPTTGDGGSPADGDGGPGTGVDEGGLPAGLLVLAGVLLVALAGAAYAMRTGRLSSDREAAAGGASGRPGGDDATDPTADGESVERAAADGDDAVGGAAADPDLLTDEDRVRRLLRERDGRMKQSAIVDELGWSKSKASRVLSGMADEGEVEKLRIGRENVIDLVADEE
ncbi:helix-turn-helix transcriptional regulator [Halorubrum xinjiangense]|uniref:helix-turn-helix transcriptional regulator n=1 Tax=Halorubrum xinjiangense TaxID=261291 RepID=UPI003C6FBABA